MPLYNWSTSTGTSNGASDSNINFAEGQSPGSVNDSARNLMAMVARWSGDISGAVVTGGTSTAYTLTSLSVFDTLAHMNGQMVGFVPNATNTNAVGVDITLNVDSLGAKPIRMQPGVAAPNGTFILGTPYLGVYNNSDGVFYVQNMLNPYVIPLAAGMDYWGSSTPNSSFAFPTGQAISRTTYATLFSLVSTTYGVGDGSTTFNLPDKTGRVSAMKEASATRLTSAVSGVDGATLGSAGAGQSSTLLTANLPAYTPAGTVTNGAISFASMQVTSVANGANAGFTTGPSTTNADMTNRSGVSQASTTFAGTAQGGTSTPVRTVQPTIVCNYILRIL